MTRKRVAAVAVGLVVAAQLAAAPAYASDINCNSGYSCLWTNRDYSGSPWFQQIDHGLYNSGWWHNDDASSVWNRRSDAYFYLYDNTNGNTNAGVACVPLGYAHAHLERVGWEDRISSMRITSSPRCDSASSTVIGAWKGTLTSTAIPTRRQQMSTPALPADPDQHLTADEVTANKILAPFDVQIVKVGGEFTLRGNLTGLDAAYLHLETSRQIPQSVKKSITAFDQHREKLFAECLADHGHPNALDHTATDPETGVDPNAAPSQLYKDCQAKVLTRYGLRFEGNTPDLLRRAKGPDAKLYESR